MKTKTLLIPLLIFSFAAPGLFASQSAARVDRAQQADRRQAEAEKRTQEAQLKKELYEKQKLEKELQEAKQQLNEAAKKVSELSTRLADKDLARLTEKDFVMAFSKRPMIGIIFDTDPNKKTDHLGIKLQGVTPGGPADQAGLKAGDILTSFNGHSLAADKAHPSPSGKLRAYMKGIKTGEKVTINYMRRGTSHTAAVTLRELAPMDLTFLKDIKIPKIPATPLPPNFVWYGSHLPSDWMDMELVELTPGLGRYFGTTKGLLVVSAPRNSSLKLEAGDVILKIGERSPDTPSQAYRVLRSYDPGDTINMNIMRNHKSMTIRVEVPAKSSRGLIIKHEGKSPRAFILRPVAPPKPPEAPASPAAPAAPAAPAGISTTA